MVRVSEKQQWKMTTVLFTQKNSVYLDLGCDCWDIDRDARNYVGSDPVIAHPPCRSWSKVRGLAKPDPGEKELSLLAIDIVRKNGGVLEHPSSSTLFPTYLPLPGSKDDYGGYSICVDQFWWGHLAKKPTLLYVVGVEEKNIPPIPFRLDCITHTIFYSKTTYKKELSKYQRSATPLAFANWLISVAELCKK